MLIAHGAKISADGSYGPATQAAVRQFQSQNGISPNGEAGPETLAALKGAAAGPATAQKAPAPPEPAPVQPPPAPTVQKAG